MKSTNKNTRVSSSDSEVLAQLRSLAELVKSATESAAADADSTSESERQKYNRIFDMLNSEFADGFTHKSFVFPQYVLSRK